MIKDGILHVHSYHSENDAIMSPKTIVERAKELGCKNITLTDHGTLSGLESFLEAGEKEGINAIPGVEGYLEIEEGVWLSHVLVVAKNYEGYIDLCKAMRDISDSVRIAKSGARKTVRVYFTKETLEKYFGNNENIFVTSACIAGSISRILLRGRTAEKEKAKIQAKMDKLKDDILLYNKETEEQIERKEQISFLREVERSLKKEIKKIEKLDGQESFLTTSKTEKETELTLRTSKREQLEKERSEATARLAKLRTKKKRYDELKKSYDEVLVERPEKLYEEAYTEAKWYQSTFSQFFIELQFHGLDDERYVMPILAKIAKDLHIPVIAANDAHIKVKEDAETRNILRYNYFFKHNEMTESEKELYLKTDEELRESLEKVLDRETVDEAMENLSILSCCKVVLPEEKHYPKIGNSNTFIALLAKKRKEMIKEGLWNEEYEKRLNKEVSVIQQMGFVDYHLIVAKICEIGRKLGKVPKEKLDKIPVNIEAVDEWVKRNAVPNGIGVGLARGSAGGSLVCYMLGITGINPLKYDLLFERFLNPERISMPDIDTDIKTSMRPYLMQYLRGLFGENAVCSIMTENTYGAKGAIKLAARDLASKRGDKIPDKTVIELGEDLCNLVGELDMEDVETEFQEKFKGNADAVTLWNRGKRLRGILYSKGLHAGGVVFSDNHDLAEYVPLAWNYDKNVWAAQMDMIRLEDRGLLKIDLLGLNTLDILSDTLSNIKKTRNQTVMIDDIPFEDEVFSEIYAKGMTNSVFQFESPGMKKTLKDFQPKDIHDIILLNAAYRPGPKDFIPQMIEVKNGKNPEYLTPALQPILEKTYGCIIYQEQVMQIVRDLAGYSYGRSDLVRRYMSKKKLDKMQVERKNFVYGNAEEGIKGCIANGISEEVGNKIYDQMISFAQYAFNKSHAAAYGILSYQTAYLKYHFGTEFLCANFENVKKDEFDPLFADARSYGIKLLPFDINKSKEHFQCEGRNIRYGYLGIKGFPNGMSFVRERELHGLYEDFYDFLDRNDTPVSVVKLLIQLGAFDCFYKDRKTLLEAYENYAKTGDKCVLKKKLKIDLGVDTTYNLTKELELIGTTLSEDPLDLINAPEKESYALGYICKAEFGISKKGNEQIVLDFVTREGIKKYYITNNNVKRYRESIESYLFKPTYMKIRNAFFQGFEKVRGKVPVLSLNTKEKMGMFVKALQKDKEKTVELRVICYFSENKISSVKVSENLYQALKQRQWLQE